MNKYILLIALIAIYTTSYAQKRTKYTDTTHHVTVVYDFFSNDPLKILRTGSKNKKPDLTDTLDIRKLYYGDKLNFRIRVNPFLYDVKVNGRNIFENSPLDTAYVKTFLSFFNTSSSASAKAQTKDAKDSTDTDATTAEKKPDLKNPATQKLIQEQFKQQFNLALPTVKDSALIRFLAEKEYKALRKQLYMKTDEVDVYYNAFEDEKLMLENVLLLALADFKEYDSIESEINSYLVYRTGNPFFTIDSLKQSTDFVMRDHQRNVIHKVSEIRSVFMDMVQLNKQFKFSTFENDSIIYVSYKNLSDSIQKENVSQFSRAYMAFLQSLGNKNLFEKTYTPDFAVADSFQFQIELHPSARARDFISLYKLSLRDTTFKPYTLPVKRFLKLNISVGLAFMFGGAVPTPYYFSTPKDQLEDNDTVFIKKGNPKSAVIPRISLLTHLYWTNANWVKPAITFGISTNPADPAETAYMGGMSLIMGQNRRMVVSGGIALANTDVLKPRYKVDEIRTKSFYSGVEETDLTEKKLRFGGFFGVSYNF